MENLSMARVNEPWRNFSNRSESLLTPVQTSQAENAHGVSPLDTAKNVGCPDLIAELQH
jgi:hypothetical protein